MKYANLEERLSQLFEKFVLLREYGDYKKEMYNKKAKWPAMQSHPLVMEIINQ